MNNLLFRNMNLHNENLSPYACSDNKAIRFKEEVEDIRSPFFHDIDRILYSYSYTRYSDKTQVFSNIKNDHITKRMQHVQYVSKIARTIGRALGLNEDLIEAASLGHDLGHVPFGHFGESVLNQISLEHHEGYFNHNAQSVRLLMYLEEKGKGKNLTLQVLDAILCHNGEFLLGEYRPVEKTFEDFLKEYEKTYTDEDFVRTLVPMTLEGCVVRISDMIAYLGRDISDALLLHMIDISSIPKEVTDVLGIENRKIIDTIIQDIIHNSLGKPYIKLSDTIYNSMKALKKFNYTHIYDLSLSEKERKEITHMFYSLYDFYFDEIDRNKESRIYLDFLDHKDIIYLSSTSKARKVIDFIAGMTDDYFLLCYNECKSRKNGYNKKEEVNYEAENL